MKLSILCAASRISILPSLRLLFDEIFVETRAWIAPGGKTDAGSLNDLGSCLGYSVDALVLPEDDDADASWVYYTLGYRAGAHLDLVFHYDSIPVVPPPWLETHPVFSGEPGAMMVRYEKTAAVRGREASELVARRTLADLDRDISPASFVQAVEKGDRFLLGLYLDAGFDPTINGDRGVPLVNLAVRGGHAALVEPLVRAGAGIDLSADDRGTTPLMDAAGNGDTRLVEYFLSHGADVNTANREGQTAVILAAGNGRENAAVMMVEAGADVDILDNLGMSARKYATLYKRQDILTAIAVRDGGDSGGKM